MKKSILIEKQSCKRLKLHLRRVVMVRRTMSRYNLRSKETIKEIKSKRI